MHGGQPSTHQPAPSHGEKQAAGGNKISIKHLEQREQSGGQNNADDPARSGGVLERNGSHEWRSDQALPRGDKAHRRDHHDVGAVDQLLLPEQNIVQRIAE